MWTGNPAPREQVPTRIPHLGNGALQRFVELRSYFLRGRCTELLRTDSAAEVFYRIRSTHSK